MIIQLAHRLEGIAPVAGGGRAGFQRDLVTAWLASLFDTDFRAVSLLVVAHLAGEEDLLLKGRARSVSGASREVSSW